MAVQAFIMASLLATTLLAFEPTAIQAEGLADNTLRGFRVFRGSEESVLEGLSPQERLDVAAKYGESYVVELTSSSQAAAAQGGASINLDCLPWCNMSSQLIEGTVQWKFIQLDQFGNISKLLLNFNLKFAGLLSSDHINIISESCMTKVIILYCIVLTSMECVHFNFYHKFLQLVYLK